MSKRIVFSTWGSFGDLHPYIALALEMQRRGHQCTIATSAIYARKIEAAGLGFSPVRPDLPDPETQRETARQLIRRTMDERDGTRFLFEELIAPHLRDSYDDLLRAAEGADLLVTHILPLTGPLVAQKLGLPWASGVLAPISFFSAHELCVPPDEKNQTVFRAARHLPPRMLAPLIEAGKRDTRRWAEPLQLLREELGLGRSGNPIFEAQHSPRLVLAMFSRALGDVQPDWPRATRVTGFCFYDKKDQSGMPPTLAAWLDAGEPPIVFTLGSSAVMDAGSFWRESIGAAKLLKRRAVLLVGSEESAPQDLPDGIGAFPYAPFGELFPRAACVVHQGGAGTTGQAMRAGVPSLVMPFTHDQPDHAARLERLGTGRQIKRARYTSQNAARELSRLLDDASYGRRAQEVAAIVRQEDGPQAAGDALEEVLRA